MASMYTDLDSGSYCSAVERLVSGENKRCFECGDVPTFWASVTLGVFLCMKCAGEHRGIGVHASFVRSLTLDDWDEKHVKYLELGGNARAREYFSKSPSAGQDGHVSLSSLKRKYETPYAAEYRDQLKREVYQYLGLPMEKEKPIHLDPQLQKFKNATSIGSSDFGPDQDRGSSCPCVIL